MKKIILSLLLLILIVSVKAQVVPAGASGYQLRTNVNNKFDAHDDSIASLRASTNLNYGFISSLNDSVSAINGDVLLLQSDVIALENGSIGETLQIDTIKEKTSDHGIILPYYQDSRFKNSFASFGKNGYSFTFNTDSSVTESSNFQLGFGSFGDNYYPFVSLSINQNNHQVYFKMDSASNKFTDQINSKGLVYGSDYSTNGLLDNRWIPDIAAVRSEISDSIVDYTGGGSMDYDTIDYVNTRIDSISLYSVEAGSIVYKDSTDYPQLPTGLDTTYYLNATGNWSVPPGGSGGSNIKVMYFLADDTVGDTAITHGDFYGKVIDYYNAGSLYFSNNLSLYGHIRIEDSTLINPTGFSILLNTIVVRDSSSLIYPRHLTSLTDSILVNFTSSTYLTTLGGWRNVPSAGWVEDVDLGDGYGFNNSPASTLSGSSSGGYASTPFLPDSVGLSYLYRADAKTWTFSGLGTGTYDVQIFSMRSINDSPARTSYFTINGVEKSVVSSLNNSTIIEYTGITPTDGNIVIDLDYDETAWYVNAIKFYKYE